jgi:hypothetical protein
MLQLRFTNWDTGHILNVTGRRFALRSGSAGIWAALPEFPVSLTSIACEEDHMSDAAITVTKPLVAGALLRFSCRSFNTVGTVRTAVEQDSAAVPELDLTLRRAQPDARVVVLDLCELELVEQPPAVAASSAMEHAR